MQYIHLQSLVSSLVFSLIGIAVFLLAYFLIEKITPENTWAEISKNKNTAVAIVFAAIIIGISLIISAAIHG